MNFVAISESEFRDYALKSPYKSFMQTPEIASLREKDGWVPYFLAVKEKDEIKAATMLVAKPTFLGKSTFIAPGGPLLDLEDTALTRFFFRHLKSYIKSHNGYVLHISPYYELVERDRSGAKVEGGYNHKKALETLKSLGFEPLKHTDQPKYLFALEIKGKTPEQIFASFKSNTRNHVRKAERLGVKVHELKKEELEKLKQITESTSKRRHFTDRSLSYYEEMYDLFHKRDEVKFLVAEKDNITLSAAMFMLYGDEVVYLFSGSDEKYMKEYNAQYIIQWHMIKYAAEHGYKTYNFYGISRLPDDNKPDGIYTFKKGFTSDETGRVIELIGSFELPITPLYHLHHGLAKVKSHLKKWTKTPSQELSPKTPLLSLILLI